MSLDTMSKQELLDLVKEAVSNSIVVHPLSPEEIQWVRLAIQAEAKRAALRDAIIQKTLAGLIWMAVIAVGVSIWDSVLQAIHHKS